MSASNQQVCTALRRSSRFVASWLKCIWGPGEESITDWLFYEIARLSMPVAGVKFTHFEEARKTGADFDWWLVGPGGALALRVQAKRLDTRKSNRGKINYANGQQMAMLLTCAAMNGFEPCYAFYAGPSGQEATDCSKYPKARKDGVFVAHARLIKSLVNQPGPLPYTRLLAVSHPLPCLVCAGAGTGISTPASTFRHFAPDGGGRPQSSKLNSDESDDAPEPRSGFYEEPPDLIVAMMQGHLAPARMNECKREYYETFGRTCAVLVTRVSSPDN